jgi:hypothetical protein
VLSLGAVDGSQELALTAIPYVNLYFHWDFRKLNI